MPEKMRSLVTVEESTVGRPEFQRQWRRGCQCSRQGWGRLLRRRHGEDGLARSEIVMGVDEIKMGFSSPLQFNR